MKSLIFSTLIAAFASTPYAQQCIGQGPGYCQGVLQCTDELFGNDITCEFDIYDSYCNLIGSEEAPNVGDAIDSQLPYTVDLTELFPTIDKDVISAQWLYAGGAYGTQISGYTQGSFTSGLVGGAYVRSSFPC
jgi:hypothetical protein